MHISGRTGKGAFGGAECSNHEMNREYVPNEQVDIFT
jgi:hypothetical protein